MKNSNNDLYSPSSLDNRGYNSNKNKFNIEYSNHTRGLEYSIDYILRRNLNYAFEYLLFPKYGRYTFIYDITEKIRNQDNSIRLFKNEYEIYDNKSKSPVCGNLIKEQYNIIHESVLKSLNDVEKTINDYLCYSKTESVRSQNRNMTLFSNDETLNNIYTNQRKISTIYDYTLNLCMDSMMNIYQKDNTLFNENTKNRFFEIEKSLNNDVNMRRIVEDMYIHTLYESYLLTEHNSCNLDTYSDVLFKNSTSRKMKYQDNFALNKSIKNIFEESIPFYSVEKREKKFQAETDLKTKKSFKSIYNMENSNQIFTPDVDENIINVQEDIFTLEKDNLNIDVEKDMVNSIEKDNLNIDVEKDIVNSIEKDNLNIDVEKDMVISIEKESGLFIEEDLYNLQKNDLSICIENYGKETSHLDNDKKKDMYNTILELNNSMLSRESNKNIATSIKDEKMLYVGSVTNIDINECEEVSIFNISNKDTTIENILELSINTSNKNIEQHSQKVLEKESGKNIEKESDYNTKITFGNSIDKESNGLNRQDLKKEDSRKIDTEYDDTLKKTISSYIDNVENQISLNKINLKTIQAEFEKQLDLHKRFWFIKTMGKIDYKILPNKDFSYPADIQIFKEQPNYIYLFEYECEYKNINSSDLIIDLYDYNYKKIDSFNIGKIKTGIYSNGFIKLNIEASKNIATFHIEISHDNLYYMIIRQPLDINEYPVLYTVTKKFLGENIHPIPFGEDLGIREIPVHINVMVDFINILMLIWSKFYYQFTGYTGIQAILGITNLVYEWITLETSNEIYDIEDYYRCFRWLRWESEKLYNMAKQDPEITGNAWIEKLIYEMAEYIEMHHIDSFPVFEQNHIMDEYRNIFDDPSFDIDIVLDKVKGVRKKVIDTNKVRRNQK